MLLQLLHARYYAEADTRYCINTTTYTPPTLPALCFVHCLPLPSCRCLPSTRTITTLHLIQPRFHLATAVVSHCLTQIFWNALIDMAMTPLRSQTLSNPSVSGAMSRTRLLSVPCVTGMPKRPPGAPSPALYYTQSLLTTDSIDNEASIKNGLRQMQALSVVTSSASPITTAPNRKRSSTWPQ